MLNRKAMAGWEYRMGRGLDKPQTITSLAVRKQKKIRFVKQKAYPGLVLVYNVPKKENNDHRKEGVPLGKWKPP